MTWIDRDQGKLSSMGCVCGRAAYTKTVRTDPDSAITFTRCTGCGENIYGNVEGELEGCICPLIPARPEAIP